MTNFLDYHKSGKKRKFSKKEYDLFCKYFNEFLDCKPFEKCVWIHLDKIEKHNDGVKVYLYDSYLLLDYLSTKNGNRFELLDLEKSLYYDFFGERGNRIYVSNDNTLNELSWEDIGRLYNPNNSSTRYFWRDREI